MPRAKWNLWFIVHDSRHTAASSSHFFLPSITIQCPGWLSLLPPTPTSPVMPLCSIHLSNQTSTRAPNVSLLSPKPDTDIDYPCSSIFSEVHLHEDKSCHSLFTSQKGMVHCLRDWKEREGGWQPWEISALIDCRLMIDNYLSWSSGKEEKWLPSSPRGSNPTEKDQLHIANFF